jgi:hypothetical protein
MLGRMRKHDAVASETISLRDDQHHRQSEVWSRPGPLPYLGAGKSVWTLIGRAYPHDEGSGLTAVFDALPLTKRIVLLDMNDSAARDGLS